MQSQVKSMKATWLYTNGGGVCSKFAITKKHSADDK